MWRRVHICTAAAYAFRSGSGVQYDNHSVQDRTAAAGQHPRRIAAAAVTTTTGAAESSTGTIGQEQREYVEPLP